MSASQARFLGLTARKNNVEYEGQQVNQQRTALSNQSANYYNDLLGMSVPIPPSVDDYTKTVYTFEDGALSNTITALIPSSKNDGTYLVSFLREFTDDFSVVSSASSVVQRLKGENGNTYMIGANTLRKLGSEASISNTIKMDDGKTYEVGQDAGGYYINRTEQVTKDPEPWNGDIYTDAKYMFWDKDSNTVSEYVREQDENGNDVFYFIDKDGNKAETPSGYTEDDLLMFEFDISKPQSEEEKATSWIDPDGEGGYNIIRVEDQPTKEYLNPSQVAQVNSGYTGTDPYLSTLSVDELSSLMQEEMEYLQLLESEFDTSDWLVRYIKDSSTGKYTPYFYNEQTLENTVYDDKTNNSLSSVNCYTIGSKKKTEEIKNRGGVKIEQDSTGRYINISFPQYDADGNAVSGSKMTTYSLTTNTMTDQDAYDDAMNKYEFEKYEYDQAINDINSKIEIVQAEDKNLELRLKQLDTEQKAISQEMDSVSNVIQKNIESSFKTFG
ncbi:hypothetical protein J6E39_03805 [bacterium]|nr:hypothetical protein [bacterium]